MLHASACVRLLAVVLVFAGCDRTTTADASDRAERRAVEVAQQYGVAALPAEGIDIETRFSKVHLQDVGLQRSMFFVRDDGSFALQSRLNFARPDLLVLPYSRVMFASYLFVPAPSRVLMVGIGGGSMVRYLERRDPELRIDAVDIDPEIVSIADRYFGTRSSDRVRLLVADGFEVVRNSADLYDVIYMDAFLRPSDETDRSGNPLRMKEGPFYAALRSRLSPEGVVAFNLNPQPERERDLDELRRFFPQLYVFHLEGESNWVAVATQESRRRTVPELETLAASLAPRFDGDVSCSEMIKLLQPPE